MKFNPNIFKAYDIRGLSPQELNPPVAYAIGRALADHLPGGVVAVGWDMRADSRALAEAIISGLVKQDREVISLGLITSDMMYYAVGSLGLAGGAMVTASHNPGKYDGIKLTGEGVVPIGIDSGLLEIEQEIEADQYKKAVETGKVTQKNILNSWVEHAVKLSGDRFKSLKIGLDAGNGMAAILVPPLQQLTPLKIDGLFLELDGSFPNHLANPALPENTKDLQKLVVENNLDCGLAFDGDADRVFLIDERGNWISASKIGAILAKYFLHLDPGGTILGNVIVSNIVPDVVQQNGGKFIRTKVGHSFIKADMRDHNAIFACEASGHFYFRDNYFADSGLLAALTVLHIMSQAEKPLSALVAELNGSYFDSGEMNFDAKDKAATIGRVKAQFTDGQVSELDGLSVNFSDWWFNLRPSNTEPVLRLNVEATNQGLLEQKVNELTSLIK
ncbi:phosphomannomutase/phosphoglucomutase [Candidatus Saccharibacteria bacterium]|nr:phosphomannomutase/phosphoglucomutase [Candidatus Saccharibacteria bacterium]